MKRLPNNDRIETVKTSSFIFNDGGRYDWHKGRKRTHVGDCVTRAVCIGLEREYGSIYKEMTKLTYETLRTFNVYRNQYPSNGVYTEQKPFIKWMRRQRLKKVIVTKPGVRVKDLNFSNQRIIVDCMQKGREHYTTIVDNVINDTWDCGEWIVNYYWIPR